MKFNLEFVEYYPNEKPSNIMGTVHLYWPEARLDLRGIEVHASKHHPYVLRVPSRKGIDPDTKEPCFYPLYGFDTPELQKAFYNEALKVCKGKIPEKSCDK